MKIPKTETAKPWYNPLVPSLATIFLQQSKRPLNCLSPSDFPISAPSLVLAKSRGYTKIKLKLPAIPPDKSDLRKYCVLLVTGSIPFKNTLLRASLVAKLIAWVGKYLRTFAQLPLQSETTPSSLTHLWKQLMMPE